MGNDEESEQKQPPAMTHPRPSEIRRHGFGSPEGMEMTDLLAPTSATKPEATQKQSYPLQQATVRCSSQSISPLEAASATALTTDSTPPSIVVAALASVSEGKSPAVGQLGLIRPLISIQKDGETPKKLQKRRLFFTPSRRKSKNPPPEGTSTTTSLNPSPNPNLNRQKQQQQQQPISMRTPISPRIDRSTTPPTQPRPRTQFRTPGSISSTGKSSARLQGRRRQTGAPMPTGLSGFTTPRSGRRRQPPTSSGQRGFNPLERVSDIFSPRSPSYSPALPINSDDLPDDGFSDSSYSDGSASASVKEPFAEQVERLDQLLATPSQQLGELAFTVDMDYRSDDDLDDEVEGLESSRRLLAEELSRVEYSMYGIDALGSDEGVVTTPESMAKITPERKTSTTSSSPTRKVGGDKEEEIDWVPILGAEAHHPPNFSPSVPSKQAAIATSNLGHYSGVSPIAMLTPGSVRSGSASNDVTVYSGEEYYSPVDEKWTTGDANDVDQEEDKKPAADSYQRLDRKNPPPLSSPEISKPSKKMSSKNDFESLDIHRRDKGLSVAASDELGESDSNPSTITPRLEPSTIQCEFEKKNSMSEEKNRAPFYTPPRPLHEENTAILSSLSRIADDSIDNEEIDQLRTKRDETTHSVIESSSQQHAVRTGDLAAISSVSGLVKAEDKYPTPSTLQFKPGQLKSADDHQQDNSKESRTEIHSPESIFSSLSFPSSGEARSTSVDVVSGSEDSTVSPSSSAGKKESIFQSFLSFAERFSDDGHSLQANSALAGDVEHSKRVLEYLNTIFQTADDKSGNKGEQSLPMGKKANGDEKAIFCSPPRDQTLTDERVFGMSPISQDSGEDQTDSQNQGQTPLMVSREENDSVSAPSFADATLDSKMSTAKKTVSDNKGSKPSKVHDMVIVVPILTDDSDDDLQFHKDSPQSVVSYDFDGLELGDSKIGFDKSGIPYIYDEEDKGSKSSCKKGLFIFALFIFFTGLGLAIFTGLGLVIGTIFYSSVEEAPVPSQMVTVRPTEEANSAPISLIRKPSFAPSGISSVPSLRPLSNTLVPSSLDPVAVLSEDHSAPPTHKGSEFPTMLFSIPFIPTGASSPTEISSVPSFRPSAKILLSSNPNPSQVPSENSSTPPTQKESEFPTILPLMSFIPTTTSSPNEISSVSSLRPSVKTLISSNLSPSLVPLENTSTPPTQKELEFPTILPSVSFIPMATFSPSGISSVPSLRPSANTLISSTLNPSAALSEEPSTPPTSKRSESPTISGLVTFTIPYKIFIANGLLEFVPQSEYIPQLITSMDLLTADILLNVVEKQNRIRGGRRLTEVALPTSITEVVDIDCLIENGLCQEVTAEVSLLDADDSWKLFKDTAELAIEIGRLQYYLVRVDPDSPADVIDSLWDSPTSINNTSSKAPADLSSLIYDTIPNNSLLSNPTSSTTTSSTIFPELFEFLEENSFDGGEALNNTSSPQYMAYSWLRDNDRLDEYSEEQLLQRYSMATLYYSTNGDQWLVNTFWLSDVSECAWFGKTGSHRRCNRKGELMNLELDLNNLNGSLPPELGFLSSALETITLSGGPNSDILGTLPTELGYLTRLKAFIVRNNDLSGTIPSEIGNWRMLKRFDLSRNRFRGEVPTQIGLLSDLRFLEVSINYLSGSLPSELGLLRKCESIFFEDNAFVSSIPTEIGELRELKALKGGLNELDSLPTELGGLKSIDFISFQDSSIAGLIPTELGNLQELRHLELGNNALSGSIPSELARIKSLQNKLDLSHNQLSGSVPTELGSLVNLRGIKLNNNLLTGVVPSELSQMSKLTSIQLDSNDLLGTIPAVVCETFNVTYPAFYTDCGDFDDNCPCCTTCCVDNTCTCQYLGTPKEFLCFQRK